MKQGTQDRILNHSKRMLLIAASTLFCSASAFADDPRDATGSQGNEIEALIERPEGAYIDSFSQDVKQHYNLAVGAMQKVNGKVRAEADRVVDAHVTRLIYRIPTSVPLSEAYESTHSQLAEGANVVWECESRECGPSDYWAYSQYNSSKLYGLDDTQRYSLFEDELGYWLMHGIQRGNKRVYMLLERIVTNETPAASSTKTSQTDLPTTDMAAVKNTLANGGVWALSGQPMPQDLLDYVVAEEKHLWLLVEARHVSLQQSMALSQDYLERLEKQLFSAGLSRQQVTGIAAGAIDLQSTQSLDPSGVRAYMRISNVVPE